MFADIDMDSLSSILTEVNGLKTFHTSFVSFLKGIDVKYKKYESTIEENLEEITNLKKEVEYYKTNYVPHDVSLMKKYIDEVQICNKERKILEKQNTNLKLELKKFKTVTELNKKDPQSINLEEESKMKMEESEIKVKELETKIKEFEMKIKESEMNFKESEVNFKESKMKVKELEMKVKELDGSTDVKDVKADFSEMKIEELDESTTTNVKDVKAEELDESTTDVKDVKAEDTISENNDDTKNIDIENFSKITFKKEEYWLEAGTNMVYEIDTSGGIGMKKYVKKGNKYVKFKKQ